MGHADLGGNPYHADTGTSLVPRLRAPRTKKRTGKRIQILLPNKVYGLLDLSF